ncbi:hypothetical protein COO60DRAFT_1219281 [Scenedesmus sp. NREL 46B-D3]|nr:hypothetical protein COO60DRAFT_1219281 [Scenedesmus sp. NREL 46B-D3]
MQSEARRALAALERLQSVLGLEAALDLQQHAASQGVLSAVLHGCACCCSALADSNTCSLQQCVSASEHRLLLCWALLSVTATSAPLAALNGPVPAHGEARMRSKVQTAVAVTSSGLLPALAAASQQVTALLKQQQQQQQLTQDGKSLNLHQHTCIVELGLALMILSRIPADGWPQSVITAKSFTPAVLSAPPLALSVMQAATAVQTEAQALAAATSDGGSNTSDVASHGAQAHTAVCQAWSTCWHCLEWIVAGQTKATVASSPMLQQLLLLPDMFLLLVAAVAAATECLHSQAAAAVLASAAASSSSSSDIQQQFEVPPHHQLLLDALGLQPPVGRESAGEFGEVYAMHCAVAGHDQARAQGRSKHIGWGAPLLPAAHRPSRTEPGSSSSSSGSRSSSSSSGNIGPVSWCCPCSPTPP